MKSPVVASSLLFLVMAPLDLGCGPGSIGESRVLSTGADPTALLGPGNRPGARLDAPASPLGDDVPGAPGAPGSPGRGNEPSGDGPSAGQPESVAGAVGGGEVDGSGWSSETGTLCEPQQASPDASPMRRLTPSEYNNSVAALFDGLAVPALTVGRDPEIAGFYNNAAGQGPTSLLVEQYRNAAREVGELASGRVADWAPCAGDGDPTACIERIALQLAQRAFRRPLTAGESASMTELATGAEGDHGFDTAVELVVRGVLQSPQFLYRPELGRPAEAVDGKVPLTGHEVATRLSYFLWSAPPDQVLLDAAASGALEDREEVARQARRLIDDPRGRDGVVDFFEQWLRLERTESYMADASVFPEYTTEVRADVVASMRLFLEHVFWEEGTVDALFTDTSAFMNDLLAGVYGLPEPGSERLVEAQFPAGERAGILTQPGLLASTSHATIHAPILRGLFVRESLLCAPLPPPPPGVSSAIEDPAPDVPRTTRQHIAETHQSSGCTSCHDAIDGVGFTFENFDAIGRFRTTENGLPVDPTGQLVAVPGIEDRELADAVELAQVMAESQRVRDCLASHMFRYALGRSDDSEASSCQVGLLGNELTEAGGDMRELVVALVSSDFFRYRNES